MRKLTCLMAALALVLCSGTSTMAALTALAEWDVGASEESNPGIRKGLDQYTDGFQEARIVNITGGGYPDVDLTQSAFSWKGGGGSLYDAPGQDGVFLSPNHDGVNPALKDGQGTIEWWFKPNYDVNVPDSHVLFHAQAGAGDRGFYGFMYPGDGTTPVLAFNFFQGDGTFVHQIAADVPDTEFTNGVFNHFAYSWDAAGTRMYIGGEKIGENIYGAGDPTVEWGQYVFLALGSRQNNSGDAQGWYDSLRIHDEAIYSGASITPPTVPYGVVLPEPATLGLIGLGGLCLMRRCRSAA